MPLGRSAKANLSAQNESQDSEGGFENTSSEGRFTFNLGFGIPSKSSVRQERTESGSSSKSRNKEGASGGARRPTITIDVVRADEIRVAHSIEAASFPREEASDLKQLMYVDPLTLQQTPGTNAPILLRRIHQFTAAYGRRPFVCIKRPSPPGRLLYRIHFSRCHHAEYVWEHAIQHSTCGVHPEFLRRTRKSPSRYWSTTHAKTFAAHSNRDIQRRQARLPRIRYCFDRRAPETHVLFHEMRIYHPWPKLHSQGSGALGRDALPN